jgi:2-hydroxychromene-2-carboxylate isomerase
LTHQVDYFLSVASPWTFLGSQRFIDLARRTGARVRVRPMDFSRVMAAAGGLPYQLRPAQRASYRQDDLARWRRRLGIALTLEPVFYPVDRTPASLTVIAARGFGQDAALALCHRVLRAIWQEDLDIADWGLLEHLANATGLNGADLLDTARNVETAEAFRQDTEAAIAAGVFGAPTWIVNGERFWGQDRLDFLEERLHAPVSPDLSRYRPDTARKNAASSAVTGAVSY